MTDHQDAATDPDVNEGRPPAIERGTEAETADLDIDEVCHLLQNERRRDVLRLLDGDGDAATISDLAEHIAAKENDVEVRQLSSDQRKRVYIALYQIHLPKLDDAGVVDYDRDRGTIVPRESTSTLREALELLQHAASPGASPPDSGDERALSNVFTFIAD